MPINMKLLTSPLFRRPELLQHPQLPAPLHGLNPRTILGQEWWDVVREEAYEKNNRCCWACGAHTSDDEDHPYLHAHEAYDIDFVAGKAKLEEIVALCYSCHNFVHSGRMVQVWRQGAITTKEATKILRHGVDVLRFAGLAPHWTQLETLLYVLNKYPQLFLAAQKVAVSNWLSGLTERHAMPAWNQWHLELNGKEYSPIHANKDEWQRAYKNPDPEEFNIVSEIGTLIGKYVMGFFKRK